MPEVNSRVSDIASAVRTYALNTASQGMSDIDILADTYIKTVLSISPPTAGDAGPISETALNFSKIIQVSKDPRTIKACLRALLRSGRFARILAARFIHSRSIALRELAAMLASTPAGDRLALGHEMLLSYPGNHDKQTLDWLDALMASVSTAPPEELTPFIASLGEQGEILAFPARQVLMHSSFEVWLSNSLKKGGNTVKLSVLCHIILALNDPYYALELSRSLKTETFAPTKLALRTVAQVAEARNSEVLDMFLSVLKSSKGKLTAPCLDGIIDQQAPAAGKLLATLYMKMPSLRQTTISRIPMLGDTAYKSFLAALPKTQREHAESEGLSALIAIAPQFVASLARTGTVTSETFPSLVQETNQSPLPATGKETCPQPGFFSRLFGPRKKTLEKLLPKFNTFKNLDLNCSHVRAEELDGVEMTDLDLTDSVLADIRFIRAKIASSHFTNVIFSGGSHSGSICTVTDFTSAHFSDITFSKCSFNDCNFTDTVFSRCTFSHCRFRNCTLAGAVFLTCTLSQVGVTSSVMAGSTLHQTTIETSRFEDVDFSATNIADSTLKGVEFPNSVLYSVTMYNSSFAAVDMPGATVQSCAVTHSDLSHVLLLRNELRHLAKLTNKAKGVPLPDSSAFSHEAAAQIMRSWSREMSFLRREERMLTLNRARLARALAGLEREKQVYLRLLPYLLDTTVFEKKFSLRGVPSCEVWGYTPCLTSLELSKQFFPTHKHSQTKPTVRILAVYAMGSLGTVAQTAKSDIDCWVCYDGDIDLAAEAGLKRKLDALGLWAESEFGLEAHFFPMRMDDVRANIFSAGDEESSGSAQALLLKEEFYRTALRIAGKNLAWWVTPAGADKKTYDECLQAARRYPLTGRPRLEDFGYLAPVPADEYFGGSLWQMVKAVHSPFKSVLKLGLLETYADTETLPLPLCDRIKHSLFLHRRGVKQTDPYAVLFNTLRRFYHTHGDKEVARLLTESFMFKANLCDIPFFRGLPARFEDASLVEAMFGKEIISPDKICNTNEKWSFEKSLKMGSSVRHFMVNTYKRIQGTLTEGDDSRVLINPEDLTRMGRRIASNFSKKKNKIMRVPFMDTGSDGFPILHMTAQKAFGKRPIWVVRGGSLAETKKSAESLQLLHRSGDPVVMLAWLLANRLYNPKSLLQADRTIAPLSVADLQKLMPAMHDFFPFEETFEPDINEGLDAERVTRAFIILNLTAAPESNKIEEVAVVYATNWGEMFCKTFLSPGREFEDHPSAFLDKNLAQPVSETPEMLLFIPKGAQCKRINLI